MFTLVIGISMQSTSNIEVHFGHMLDDLGNHLCDENGNRFKFYE